MKIDGTSGFRIQLASIKQKVKPSSGDEASAEYQVYHQGDPVFDTHAAKLKEQLEPHLPKNFLAGSAGGADGSSALQLSQKISQVFDQYYAGTADEHAIEATLSYVVGNLKQSYADMGFDPEQFMPKLLRDVYDYARLSTVGAAGVQSWKDSRALTAKYNGSDRNSRDVIYYDAKYYYQSEELKGTVQSIMKKIGQQHGVSDLDLPMDYPDGSLQKSIYSSYNTIINEKARNDELIGNMLDETMVPPKGFRFFYKGNDAGMNRYPPSLPSDGTIVSAFDGILHVWYGDWSFTGRVPVRQDATRFPVSVNMYELISSKNEAVPDEIVPMLKNFDFFTMIQSGNYFPSHPRHF